MCHGGASSSPPSLPPPTPNRGSASPSPSSAFATTVPVPPRSRLRSRAFAAVAHASAASAATPAAAQLAGTTPTFPVRAYNAAPTYGPTPAPVAAPSSNSDCEKPVRGKNVRACAMPLGNIPAQPTPTSAVVAHNTTPPPRLGLLSLGFRVLQGAACDHHVASHPSAASATRCDARITRSGDAFSNDSANRVSVNHAHSDDVNAAAAPSPRPSSSCDSVYIQLPYVTSRETAKDM
eukprot:31159-Pelagococcus_subviridis.AAC.1